MNDKLLWLSLYFVTLDRVRLSEEAFLQLFSIYKSSGSEPDEFFEEMRRFAQKIMEEIHRTEREIRELEEQEKTRGKSFEDLLAEVVP